MLQSRLSYWWLINGRSCARVTSLKKDMIKLKFNSRQRIPVYLPPSASESTLSLLLSCLDTDLLLCQVATVKFLMQHESVPKRNWLSTLTQYHEHRSALPLPIPSDPASYSRKKTSVKWSSNGSELLRQVWSCFVILVLILDTRAILFQNKTFFR